MSTSIKLSRAGMMLIGLLAAMVGFMLGNALESALHESTLSSPVVQLLIGCMVAAVGWWLATPLKPNIQLYLRTVMRSAWGLVMIVMGIWVLADAVALLLFRG